MTLLVHWMIYAVAIVITAYLLPGVRLSGFFAALVTALVLGLVNTFIKPLLLLLTLPLNILTLASSLRDSGGRCCSAWSSPSSTTYLAQSPFRLPLPPRG
jgi:hypothetical protein